MCQICRDLVEMDEQVMSVVRDRLRVILLADLTVLNDTPEQTSSL